MASRLDERWAMDFMGNELYDGRRIRDRFTGETLWWSTAKKLTLQLTD